MKPSTVAILDEEDEDNTSEEEVAEHLRVIRQYVGWILVLLALPVLGTLVGLAVWVLVSGFAGPQIIGAVLAVAGMACLAFYFVSMSR
jgi:uncharacterized membrane protein YccC